MKPAPLPAIKPTGGEPALGRGGEPGGGSIGDGDGGGRGGGLGGAMIVGAAKSTTAEEGKLRLLATEAAKLDKVETVLVARSEFDEPSCTTVTDAWPVGDPANALMGGMLLPMRVLRAVVALVMFRVGAAGNVAPESKSTLSLASKSTN